MKLPIICKKHGVFYQRDTGHYNKGYGCQKCIKVVSPHKALSWLEHISKEGHIYIQHAGNAGEFSIPGHDKLYVDGYCNENNTVYQFHGDAFHGNLNIYREDHRPHPYDKRKTAKQLFESTKRRDKMITEAGFNLIVMWESDYDKSGIVTKRFDDLVDSRLEQEYPIRFEECTNLSIIGKYVGSREKHLLHCNKCGYEWYATPVSKMGSYTKYGRTGCPKCNKITKEEK